MTKFRGIKVVLRGPEGFYLAGTPAEWEYTEDLTEATVFDYVGDRVDSELQKLRQTQGSIFQAVQVVASDLCEVCDLCQQRMLPIFAIFDGQQFLCPDCSENSQRLDRKTAAQAMPLVKGPTRRGRRRVRPSSKPSPKP